MNSEDVKAPYSDDAILILQLAKIDFLLKENHKMREIVGMKSLDDNELIIYSLKMYERWMKRKVKTKERKDGR